MHHHPLEGMHLSVTSPAGAYTVRNRLLFDWIMRLATTGPRLRAGEREALDLLGSIPHAFFDSWDDEEEGEEILAGQGWRIVPAQSLDDWPVLESTPQRLRTALETLRALLWERAPQVGMTARELVALEKELDEFLSVLHGAEGAGSAPITLSYVGPFLSF